MSSLNCFKRPAGVPVSQSRLVFRDGAVDSVVGREEFDGSTVQDNLSSFDDHCSLHSERSRFDDLKCQSPRPDSHVVRSLKSASLSSKYRSRLRGSNPSPMLSCMKGSTRQSTSKKKRKSKQLEAGSYDTFDPQDLQRHVEHSAGNLSCLVRSHSDSVCLSMNTSHPAGDTNSDVSVKPPDPLENPSSTVADPNINSQLQFAPQLFFSPSTPSYGFIPSSPYVNCQGFFNSPQISATSGYNRVMTTSSLGTPTVGLGIREQLDSGFQGCPYPSPQLSTYSLMLPYFRAPVYPDYFQPRPCSFDGYSGGSVPLNTSSHRTGIDNHQQMGDLGTRTPAHLMASPMPHNKGFTSARLNHPNTYDHHRVQQQKQLTATPKPDEGTSTAPPSSRHQFDPRCQPSPRGTPMSSAFRRLNSNLPPSYDSVQASGMVGRHSGNGVSSGGGMPFQPTPLRPDIPSSPSGRGDSVRRAGRVRSPPAGPRIPSSPARPTSPSSFSPRPQGRVAASPLFQHSESVTSPLSPNDEARLSHFLRARDGCEQLLQINHRLERENAEMANQVATKDRELKSYNHRSDQLSTNLQEINMWCEWLANGSFSSSNSTRPGRSPSIADNDDATRWKTAYDELCRLDKTIAKLRTRSPHPTVSRMSATPTKPPHLLPTGSATLAPPASSLPPKPVSDFTSGRHSSAGVPKISPAPAVSPRCNRPGSAPAENDSSFPPPQPTILPPSQPPPRLPLPSSSPNPRKTRYASQKEINATYLTPPQRRNDRSDEYKRSASELLQAHLQSIEVILPEATKLSTNDPVPLASFGSPATTTAIPYPDDDSTSVVSTNSSSVDTPRVVKKSLILDGSEDSAIADTEESPVVDQESPRKYIDGSKKTILRRITGDDGGEGNGTEKAMVRFHPLALLLDAALEGDFELVKKAATEVSDVSESNDEGITALHNAVCAGRSDVVEFLVREAGADVNSGDVDGWTPLHCAASCGNIGLARLLVENGAALHARTLSHNDTSLEKCDQGDLDAECERYLSAEQDLLGSADEGRVYALFPRGLEAAGPGSPDAHIAPDELPIWPNEQLCIIDRCPEGEPDWMLAEKVAPSTSSAQQPLRGLVPRAFISRFPLVRVPPASRPMAHQPKSYLQHRSPSPIDEVGEDDAEESGAEDTADGDLADKAGSPQMIERSEMADDEAMVEEDRETDGLLDDETDEMVDNQSTSEISLNGHLSDDMIVRTAM